MTTVFSALPMPKGGRRLFPQSSGLRALVDPKEQVRTLNPILSPLGKGERSSTDPALDELNGALDALAHVFPDVQPEVFREMLMNISKESRIEIVTEHLLKDKGKWAKGRYRTSARPKDAPISTAAMPTAVHLIRGVLPEDRFRSVGYRLAVKRTFYEEFKGLSHSAIKAVLAEQNYSYTLCRPILQQLASKSWRHYLTSFWSRRRNLPAGTGDHPLVNWIAECTSAQPGRIAPRLRSSGDDELDVEIHATLIAPVLARYRDEDMQTDHALAENFNEEQAQAAEAMYDCECCYTSNTFEQTAACDVSGHYICFRCITRATTEALFGQGWARNISNEKISVRCLAASSGECDGCVPKELAKRAVCSEKDGEQTWRKLEDRVAADSISNSQLPILQCPFCPYAEFDDDIHTSFRTWFTFADSVVKFFRLRLDTFLGATLAVILFCAATATYPFALILLLFLRLTKPDDFHASLRRNTRKRNGLRFECRSPTCSVPSCSLCLALWTDPHICHETSTLSLRHAIESATTAAVKRTCPKCHLSFVKSSGCNKLVCNCGYAMCYVCRNEIGKEGYGHFCQHFREVRGRCTECERCDLYVVEDEDRVIRRAAEKAEMEWRIKEGGIVDGDGNADGQVKGVKSSMLLAELNARGSKPGVMAKEVISGTKHEDTWSLDFVLDALLQALLA